MILLRFLRGAAFACAVYSPAFAQSPDINATFDAIEEALFERDAINEADLILSDALQAARALGVPEPDWADAMIYVAEISARPFCKYERAFELLEQAEAISTFHNDRFLKEAALATRANLLARLGFSDLAAKEIANTTWPMVDLLGEQLAAETMRLVEIPHDIRRSPGFQDCTVYFQQASEYFSQDAFGKARAVLLNLRLPTIKGTDTEIRMFNAFSTFMLAQTHIQLGSTQEAEAESKAVIEMLSGTDGDLAADLLANPGHREGLAMILGGLASGSVATTNVEATAARWLRDHLGEAPFALQDRLSLAMQNAISRANWVEAKAITEKLLALPFQTPEQRVSMVAYNRTFAAQIALSEGRAVEPAPLELAFQALYEGAGARGDPLNVAAPIVETLFWAGAFEHAYRTGTHLWLDQRQRRIQSAATRTGAEQVASATLETANIAIAAGFILSFQASSADASVRAGCSMVSDRSICTVGFDPS